MTITRTSRVGSKRWCVRQSARAPRGSLALTRAPPSKAADGDLPHLLFYGPQGAGKKTRIMALLRAIYGGGCEKARATYVAARAQTHDTR